MATTDRPHFGGIVSGTNGVGPHGMARYGDEWRKIEPVDGVLTMPNDADEYVVVAGGGAGSGGASTV